MNLKLNLDYLNVVKCDGATCISLNNNIKKYYAEYMNHRTLKPKVYKYERD